MTKSSYEGNVVNTFIESDYTDDNYEGIVINSLDGCIIKREEDINNFNCRPNFKDYRIENIPSEEIKIKKIGTKELYKNLKL